MTSLFDVGKEHSGLPTVFVGNRQKYCNINTDGYVRVDKEVRQQAD